MTPYERYKANRAKYLRNIQVAIAHIKSVQDRKVGQAKNPSDIEPRFNLRQYQSFLRYAPDAIKEESDTAIQRFRLLIWYVMQYQKLPDLARYTKLYLAVTGQDDPDYKIRNGLSSYLEGAMFDENCRKVIANLRKFEDDPAADEAKRNVVAALAVQTLTYFFDSHWSELVKQLEDKMYIHARRSLRITDAEISIVLHSLDFNGADTEAGASCSHYFANNLFERILGTRYKADGPDAGRRIETYITKHKFYGILRCLERNHVICKVKAGGILEAVKGKSTPARYVFMSL